MTWFWIINGPKPFISHPVWWLKNTPKWDLFRLVFKLRISLWPRALENKLCHTKLEISLRWDYDKLTALHITSRIVKSRNSKAHEHDLNCKKICLANWMKICMLTWWRNCVKSLASSPVFPKLLLLEVFESIYAVSLQNQAVMPKF